MSRVTLHGMIPVYVQVDPEDGQINRVVASDEEFVFVGARDGRGNEITNLRAKLSEELPLAYMEDGTPIDDHELIRKALQVAQNEDWPSWRWGW